MVLELSVCRYATSSTLWRSSTLAGALAGDLVGDLTAPVLFLANAAADRAAGLLLSDMMGRYYC